MFYNHSSFFYISWYYYRRKTNDRSKNCFCNTQLFCLLWFFKLWNKRVISLLQRRMEEWIGGVGKWKYGWKIAILWEINIATTARSCSVPVKPTVTELHCRVGKVKHRRIHFPYSKLVIAPNLSLTSVVLIFAILILLVSFNILSRKSQSNFSSSLDNIFTFNPSVLLQKFNNVG